MPSTVPIVSVIATRVAEATNVERQACSGTCATLSGESSTKWFKKPNSSEASIEPAIIQAARSRKGE